MKAPMEKFSRRSFSRSSMVAKPAICRWVSSLPKPLFRLGHQDQGAAVGHHLQGVGEGLDGLVEIQVLGIAAGAGDDQRGLLLHRHAVHPVHQITGRPVGR